jgi:hypothetical protein
LIPTKERPISRLLLHSLGRTGYCLPRLRLPKLRLRSLGRTGYFLPRLFVLLLRVFLLLLLLVRNNLSHLLIHPKT